MESKQIYELSHTLTLEITYFFSLFIYCFIIFMIHTLSRANDEVYGQFSKHFVKLGITMLTASV